MATFLARTFFLGRTLRAVALLLTGCMAFLITSCTPQTISYPSLANQGILGLSTTNGYLGTNLFLSRELEKSPYLFNFFKGKGAPTAIEIVHPPGEMPKLLLYYPREKEVYAASLQQVGDRADWITRGPYSIDHRDYRQLMRMSASLAGEPVFVIYQREYRFHPNENLDVARVLKPIPPPPTPTPRPVKKKVSKKSAEVKKKEVSETTVSAEDALKPGKFKPLNTDQMALAIEKGFAERDTNGDVIHTVRFTDETLEKIAKWYTGSRLNGKLLANLNNLPEEKPLAAGTTVRVPYAKLKRVKRMPEDFDQ